MPSKEAGEVIVVTKRFMEAARKCVEYCAEPEGAGDSPYWYCVRCEQRAEGWQNIEHAADCDVGVVLKATGQPQPKPDNQAPIEPDAELRELQAETRAMIERLCEIGQTLRKRELGVPDCRIPPPKGQWTRHHWRFAEGRCVKMCPQCGGTPFLMIDDEREVRCVACGASRDGELKH